MSDLISRDAAIDLFPNDVLEWDTLDGYIAPHVARRLIEDLPSAQPERKTGRWKMEPDPYGFFEEIPVCSECGCTTEMRKTYKFCPNCGADMRGEQDDKEKT